MLVAGEKARHETEKPYVPNVKFVHGRKTGETEWPATRRPGVGTEGRN